MCVSNVIIIETNSDSQQILQMWNACKKTVYDGLSNNNMSVVNYCATCIAYLYQIDYLDFKSLELSNCFVIMYLYNIFWFLNVSGIGCFICVFS